MKITLSQLKRIIKEEVRRSLNEVDEDKPNRPSGFGAKADAEDVAHAKYMAERKPVPDQTVKYVIDNVFDKGGKLYGNFSEEAVEELLTDRGYKSPGKNHVDFTDIDQVKRAIRKDSRYKTAHSDQALPRYKK